MCHNELKSLAPAAARRKNCGGGSFSKFRLAWRRAEFFPAAAARQGAGWLRRQNSAAEGSSGHEWLLHVGYCEVYQHTFKSFFGLLVESKKFLEYSFSRNESSTWMKVPGSKFLERSLPRNTSSTGVNVPGHESSWNVHSHGTEVPRTECSTERKFQGSECSLCGLLAPGSESAGERKVRHSISECLIVNTWVVKFVLMCWIMYLFHLFLIFIVQ